MLLSVSVSVSLSLDVGECRQKCTCAFLWRIKCATCSSSCSSFSLFCFSVVKFEREYENIHVIKSRFLRNICRYIHISEYKQKKKAMWSVSLATPLYPVTVWNGVSDEANAAQSRNLLLLFFFFFFFSLFLCFPGYWKPITNLSIFACDACNSQQQATTASQSDDLMLTSLCLWFVCLNEWMNEFHESWVFWLLLLLL